MKTNIFNNWPVVIVLTLVLGFAPFYPEPHIVEQFRWAYYGGKGMRLIDYIDLAMHALPFVLFIRLGFKTLRRKNAD